MKYLMMFGFIAFSSSLIAQPAVYKGSELTIPQGVVVSGESPVYYENIVLSNEGGSFVPQSADIRTLASVESATVNVMESLPVQVSVTISGTKSIPCIDLLTPAVVYADNTFNVVLAVSELGPAETCIQVTEPFETTVTLDVTGLSAGTYSVNVNNAVTEEFELQTGS
ncbi:MAG: hypothetical protein RKH07_03995 [Gammaproteobacteria bacterium]